ncbi:MAG: glutathione S-transferase [Alphaproteobacteria bacterium]|nr:MAG: glutathione S-transferase [Alphaproteobacteria bacterium]
MEHTLTLPLISGYTAALLGTMQVALMMTVGFARRTAEVSLGDGGNDVLHHKIRRHGNLAENAPIFLILLGLLEITGGQQNIVLGLAVVFVMARLSHAYALSGPGKPVVARAMGAMGTLIGVAGTAGALVWQLSMVQ